MVLLRLFKRNDIIPRVRVKVSYSKGNIPLSADGVKNIDIQ